MNASTAAAALAALLDDAPAWLPPVDHWEVAQDDDRWIVQGQLATDGDTLGEGAAYRLLGSIVEQSGRQLTDDGRLIRAEFTHFGFPMNVWYLRPILRWIVPEQCATCPTKLGAPDVRFVRLGEGDRQAPVICVPCRDEMQASWVSRTCAAAGDRTDHDWWYSLPDDGWKCTWCHMVRTDASNPASMTRPPRVPAGESA